MRDAPTAPRSRRTYGPSHPSSGPRRWSSSSSPIEIVRSPRRALPRVQIGVAAAFAVALLGAMTQLVTPETDQAFASPQQYATTTQLSREVAQIIADGEAFSRHQGDAFPL